ncbi:MAG: hypothetical protein VYC82_02415, partial [Verrucomicrobiota bacterium]|nr:hypothetical protein [Verrucomicrobiota bacterium]
NGVVKKLGIKGSPFIHILSHEFDGSFIDAKDVLWVVGSRVFRGEVRRRSIMDVEAMLARITLLIRLHN